MKYYVYFDAYGHVRQAISEKELTDYLESLGDEIAGFYKADADSRPYNF